MGDLVRVALDAMGGDNAPKETVMGAVDAANTLPNAEVYLVGKKEIIEDELLKYSYPKDRIKVIPASEVIETGDPPVMAIRRKKDSSMVVGLNLVKSGRCDAFVSAGSSGAILVGGQFIVGRIRGVERSPLAPVFPTTKGVSILIDCGANVDARPSHLVQFAKMGSIYMENIMGIKSPRVGILNIGVEEEKGNALVKETYPLLLNCPEINFIGSVEARDIPEGAADVIVCEAFVGNVALKTYEGVGLTMLKEIKDALNGSFLGKLGGLLIKGTLKKALKKFDVTEYGGAPLLGLNGLVVKAHGSSRHKEITLAIEQCVAFTEQRITEKIRDLMVLKD